MKRPYMCYLLAAAVIFSADVTRADSIDFSRFLASPAGAAGVAAAVAGLGHCDTPLSWSPGMDPFNGNPDPDALIVGCQYRDMEDNELYDKSVVAKFQFWSGAPALESLTYLP